MTRGSSLSLKVDTSFRRVLMLVNYLAVSALSIFVVPQNQESSGAILTVYVNERKLGDLEAEVGGGEIRLPSGVLETGFAPILDASAYEFLARRAEAEGFLSASTLRGVGIVIEYDELSLVLRLRVPARLMALRYLGSGGAVGRDRLPEKFPAFFSGYVNSSLRATGHLEAEKDPYAVFYDSLEGAVNVADWVAESAVELETAPVAKSGDFRLSSSEVSYARLVRDFRGAGIRMTAGTVDLPWHGFQTRFSAVGINFVRDETVRLPGTVRPPLPRVISDTFTVERWARVAVKVNGAVVYSTQVETGRYRFADFPFVTGLNEVEIEITESYKNPVRYRMGVPFDSSALRAGAADFQVGFGVDDAEYAEPFFSGFLNYGLTDTETAGLSLQTGHDAVLASFGLSAATRIGLFGLEGAQSFAPEVPGVVGYALSALYRYSLAARPYAPRLGLRSRFSWPGFSPPVAVRAETSEDFVWLLAANISQATPAGLFLSMSGEYEGASGKPESSGTQFSLGVSAPLGDGATLHSSASVRRLGDSVSRQFSVSLSVIPPGDGSSFMYRQDLVSGETSASVTRSVGSGVGSHSYTFTADNPVGPAETSPGLGGSLRRTGRLGDLYASAAVRDLKRDDSRSSSFSLGFDNGLAFAEGILAPSRKIGDSFALLDPDPSFGNNPVEMRYGSDQTVVEAGKPPRVAALLSAYSEGIATIDTPGSPPDVSARENRVRLRPTYKSGIVVRPERTVSVYASGRQADAAGAPVAWMSGRAESEDGAYVGALFTDEDGRFELYELAQGRYTLVWASGSLAPVSFDVPPRADGRIDLGTVGGPIGKGESK